MYHLASAFGERYYGHPPAIKVVGCGGTGGFAAEGLCRMLPKDIPLILIDYDTVEEANLTRQNFFREDIGEKKCEALAKRLARKYWRRIAYSTTPVNANTLVSGIATGITLGCVDNGLARRDIAKSLNRSWWVDAGNGENYGQILIGNSDIGAFREDTQVCFGLPIPTIQRPDLLLQAPPPLPGCEELPEQGPTINQVMAVLLVEVVRRIIEGTCPWMQLLVDIQTGEMHPVMATPEAAIKIVGKSKVEVRKGGD